LIIALASMLGVVSVADAQALELRFVHAVPGAGSATLTAGGEQVGGSPGFSGVTSYSKVPDGEVKLQLRAAGGGDALASAEESLSGGRYTVVAFSRDDRVRLEAYREERPREGSARVRAIDAAGELGEVAVRLGDTTLARGLGPGEGSPYRGVDPGTYDLTVSRARGQGGALASRKGVAVSAGTASTAVVVGSGGEATRVVLLPDGTAAPSAAPGTGLGGLEGGTAWAAVLGAALAAGALGGAAYTLARRRGA
jgi:hypothetical protein